MHIAFIEDTDLHGGTQIWVSEAVRRFLKRGHEVTVITSESGFNAQDTRETEARLVTYDWQGVVRQSAEHRQVWADGLAGTDVAICTVHPPRDGFHCSVFAAECIAEAGLDTYLVPKTGTIVPEYERRFYVPEPDINWHTIAITKFTREALIKDYEVPADHVSLVYQGTEVNRFTPDAERARKARDLYPLIKDAGPVLGCLGSFEERKAQGLLLEAVAAARDAVPRLQLLLVGDGPDEAMLKEKTRELGLEETVRFFPFTREPEIVFELLDAIVLSSVRKEGLPNVLLEGMSMGLPVISTRLAGTPEVVHDGETGLLVEPGDVPALTQAIIRLGGDGPGCRRMGLAARALMQSSFDKEVQFDQFLTKFSEILG